MRLRSDPAPGANGLSAAARPKAARGRGGEQGHGASHVTAGLTTKYKYLNCLFNLCVDEKLHFRRAILRQWAVANWIGTKSI